MQLAPTSFLFGLVAKLSAVAGPRRCITIKVKSAGVNAVFHENTKLKKEEEEEDYLRI